MSADRLTAWGIVAPATVVQVAAAAGLPLAAACALLEQESGGGHNVWGHDPVATAATYVKGAEVTETAYKAYRAALAAGTAGQQGVGPCQLTSRGFQDQADQAGGCWQPAANMSVGFGLLARYVKAYGLRGAFVAYNGGPGALQRQIPAAEAYGDAAMAKYQRWVDRLGATSTTPAAAGTEDDVAWTHDEGAPPVPDYYPGASHDLPDPLVALAWAAAHSAVARDVAQGARADIAALRADLTQGRITPAVDYEKLAAVLLPQLVAALTKTAPLPPVPPPPAATQGLPAVQAAQ